MQEGDIMEIKRNLAFYKESDKPWTQEEYDKLCKYVGFRNPTLPTNRTDRKFIYDDGTYCNSWFYAWDMQVSNNNFTNCTQISYESIFPSTEDPYAELKQAYSDGKRIQQCTASGNWVDVHNSEFTAPTKDYCILSMLRQQDVAQSQTKENTMNQDNITITMTAKEYEKYTEAKQPEESKTDYEARLPFAMVVYEINGTYECIHYSKTAKALRKRAKAYLQLPCNLGKRITLHQTLDKPLTTSIPIVEID